MQCGQARSNKCQRMNFFVRFLAFEIWSILYFLGDFNFSRINKAESLTGVIRNALSSKCQRMLLKFLMILRKNTFFSYISKKNIKKTLSFSKKKRPNQEIWYNADSPVQCGHALSSKCQRMLLPSVTGTMWTGFYIFFNTFQTR